MTAAPSSSAALDHDPAEASAGILTSLAGVLLTGWGFLILATAMLRENPMFWRNDGGYPVALRDLVRTAFYPGYLLHAGLIAAIGFSGWRLLARRHLAGAPLLLASLLNLVLFAVITVVVVWNNLENLLAGRGLHFHGN